MRALAFALLLIGFGLPAQADPAGRFDYWLLSLSWSPQFCSNRYDDQQCQRPYAFVVHGLWPQNRRGYPENCGQVGPVNETLVERMLPLMPSPHLIQHEWRTHGSCSGLGMQDYFLTIERLHRDLAIPPPYRSPVRYIDTTPDALADAFIQANPGLRREDMTLRCSGHYLKEVRICYDKTFGFTTCGEDQRQRCRSRVTLRPVR